MTEFLKKLTDKLLDFFNFGRFITIALPGLLIAMAITMFVSQLLFPHIPFPADTQPAVASLQGEAKERPGTAEGSQTLFQRQLQADFGRLWRHGYLVAVLVVIFGLMNYELGYWVLGCQWFQRPPKDQLYPYCPAHDADDRPARKFQAKVSRGRLVGLDHFCKEGDAVGLVYFAPFLKEKFSGEENYFTFLITEFYRFVEVSVVVPLALIQSSVLGVAYCWLFWWRRDLQLVLPFMLGVVSIGLSVIFLRCVSTKIAKAYYRACYDLIHGVSDFMSKQLGSS